MKNCQNFKWGQFRWQENTHMYTIPIHFSLCFMHLKIQMHIQNHIFCKSNLLSPIIPEKSQQAQMAFKIAIFTESIHKQIGTYDNERSSNRSELWPICLDLFLKTNTYRKIRTAFKLKRQVFWKYITEQVFFVMERLENDRERSEIKEIRKQMSSYWILAGFPLTLRLALNQAILQGFLGCSKLWHMLRYISR